MLKGFFIFNRSICQRLTPKHVHEANVFGMYRKLGIVLFSHPRVSRVVDCGAGKAWHFPDHYKRWYGIHLIGIDVSAQEMEANTALDEKLVADVTETIPVTAGTIDLITVSSGIEHFRDNATFLRNAHGCLRPGGFLLAQFPGRYAPFAIANRVLPGWLTKLLLRYGMEADAESLGFPAHYDRTHYSGFAKIADQSGFDVLYYFPGFFSSAYAEFFLPLWLCSYMYDVLRFALGLKNLSSHNLFVLQKRDASADTEPLRLYAWST